MPIWAYSTSMGELKSMTAPSGLRVQSKDRVVAAYWTNSRVIVELCRERRGTDTSGFKSEGHSCPGRRARAWRRTFRRIPVQSSE
jgi:hypothetical protein